MFYEIKFNSVHIEKELKTKKDNVLLIFAFIVVGLIALIYGANLLILLECKFLMFLKQ